jgi:hypothetical protein
VNENVVKLILRGLREVKWCFGGKRKSVVV